MFGRFEIYTIEIDELGEETAGANQKINFVGSARSKHRIMNS